MRNESKTALVTRTEPSIASVTVAHNSKEIIGRQIDALSRQTHTLNEIIVVDNGSVDGTSEFVGSRYPFVTVLKLPRNEGMGGGASAGLQYATARGHDWVWLLDDDSIPASDGLERLLTGLHELDGFAERTVMLAPVPVNSQTGLTYPGLIWRNGWTTSDVCRTQEGVSFVDVVISSGSLLRSDAIRKVGLPRTDFFIDFVDFEYCLRLREHGYKIGVVQNCLLEHTIGVPRRASILGLSWSWSDHPPFREFYLWRNYTFTIWQYFPNLRSKLFVIRRLLRHGAGVALFGKRKIACLRMMYLGFLDGRIGKLGIRFPNDSINA